MVTPVTLTVLAAVTVERPVEMCQHAAVTNHRAPGVGTRLRADLKRAQISARGLARALVGPGATTEQIETRRIQVQRWLTLEGEAGMHPESAERIAEILGSDPQRYVSRAPAFNRRTQIDREIAKHRARIADLLDEKRHLDT